MKGKFWPFFLALGIWIISPGADSFVRTRNSLGLPIYWNLKTSFLPLFVNPNNNDGLTDTQVMTTLNASIAQWTPHTAIPIQAFSLGDIPQNGRNDIFFTNSPGFFSSGTLAVTSVSYLGATGEIIEGDIYLNDSINFSNTFGDTQAGSLGSKVFVGDILTHELGHLLGLGHSQVRHSSMLFTAFNGQYTTHEDDHMAMGNVAPPAALQGGTIRGKIIGSKKLVGIIGAQVQFISLKSGRVVAGVFSDGNGDFFINNLPLEDTYYLYIHPMNIQASIPGYYLTAQKNFCLPFNYRGDFYSKCDTREQGFPQGIRLSSTEKNIDVGLVTIKCQLTTPQAYLDKKAYGSLVNSTYEVKVKQNNASFGNAFVGTFNSMEIQDRTLDVIKLDFSELTPANNLYLDLKLVSQDLFSKLRTTVRVFRNGVAMGQFPDSTETIDLVELDGDGNPNAQVVARVPLSLVQADNVFEIQIKPFPLDSDVNYGLESFIPAPSSFADSLVFYFLMVSVSKKNTDDSFSLHESRNYKPYEDNSSCPDAPGAISLGGFVSTADLGQTPKKATPTSSQKSQEGGFLGSGCGTWEDGPGSGDGKGSKGGGQFLMQMFVGLGLQYFLWQGVRGRRRRKKFSS